jgi:hypothetical protein
MLNARDRLKYDTLRTGMHASHDLVCKSFLFLPPSFSACVYFHIRYVRVCVCVCVCVAFMRVCYLRM